MEGPKLHFQDDKTVSEVNLAFKPVVIIGAGRSGTNALRNMICSLHGFSTWPCDEINPIWRHANTDWPNDQIPTERATGRARYYIRRAFLRFWNKNNRPQFVVEKTCANSLRIPFVDATLPDAKYIQIVRNGLEVTASAEKRWRGELEVPSLLYFAAKVRYVPVADIPRYAIKFVRNRLALAFGKHNSLSVWGPHFNGMLELREKLPLSDVCALQWATCVEASDAAFGMMPAHKVHLIYYEELVLEPERVLRGILSFLDTEVSETDIEGATQQIYRSSRSRRPQNASNLLRETQERLAPVMARHGYSFGD